MKKLINPIKFYLIVSGFAALMFFIGTGGASDLNTITLKQTVIRSIYAAGYMVFALVTYKVINKEEEY